MTLDYQSHLADWLRELKLSEPEIGLVIPDGEGTRKLLLAFPGFRLGICEDATESGKQEVGDWTLWGCATNRTVRQALGQIAVLMGTISEDKTSPDVSRLDMLMSQKLWESAEEEVNRLIDQLDADDPFLTELKERRKEIRRELRKSQSPNNPSTVLDIGKPVSQVIREDIGRIKTGDLPAHHFIGFFTQRNVELDGLVDAVWSATIGSGDSIVWTGCAVGSETLRLDASIEPYPTETELLFRLLENNDDASVIWVWDRAQILPTLKKWHFRTTGKPLPDTIQNKLFDLRALSLIAFPTAQRSDKPENLCKELKIKFQDELGNGGILAAMEALLQASAAKLQSAVPVLQTAWRNIFLHYLPPEWIENLFPEASEDGFDGYLHVLEETFRNLPEPVQSSVGQATVEGLTLNDFFKKPDGFVAQVTGDGYEERKGQMDFANQVLSGLQESKPFVLEAGTGIGKTKGYLIPLLLNGKRAYVATHTKNLQDQAWYKDVPEALKALELAGVGRSVSVLKGKNNYVCLQTIVDWLEDIREVIRKQEDAFTLAAVLHWLLQTKTGWLIELGSLNNRAMIARLARDQAAPGLSETWGELDPHKRAVEAAQSVDLVLVNHSYVFARAKMDTDDGAPLDAIVFDEAHNIEDGVTEALTLDFTPWELQAEISKLLDRSKEEKKITGPFRPLLEFEDLKRRPIVQNFAQALFDVENGIDEWCLLCGQRFAELRDQRYIETGEDTYNEDPDNPVLFTNDRFWIPSLLQSAQTLLQQTEILKSVGENLLEELPRIQGVPKRIQSSVSAFIQDIDENVQALQKILDFNDQDSVRWGEARVQADESGTPRLVSNSPVWEGVLHSTPLEVSTWLRNHLYPKYPHKIFVSATLAMGERFENILSRLGLTSEDPEKQASTHVFPSPFNYKDQVLLSVFSDSAYPANTTDTLYLDSLAKNISQLAKLGEGRTLVLFTSRKTLHQVGLRLRAELEADGILPLMQTEDNRAALVERFRSAPKVGEKLVLLGLRAFWEGVDIPGDPLRILVISKLPFDYYGHPVAIARRDHFFRTNPTGDYFREVVIPGTFLHLRQMYGRLIRKEDDRGVCVFLDPRIAEKRYGRYLLDLLPLSQRISAPRERNIEQIQRFLDGQKIESEFTEAVPEVTSAELSSEQLNIVNAPDKRILVRAAAGSGKTRVLSERIIRIIQEGKAPDPARILALTYTVKAEKVLQDRLYEALGPRAFDLERNILTYHKFAYRILRSDFQGTGNEVNWVNEDSPEEQELFAFARSKSSLSEDDLSNEDARTIVAFAQNGLVDEDQLELHIQDFDPFTKKLALFYLAYVQKLRETGLLDFGEAIVRAVTTLRNDVEKRQKWANKYDWIFCDEYQDTSPAQSRLLDLIGQQANLFVVGDSAQSIYSWMGADPDNLYQFETDFPGTIVYHLSKNYRSFPKLVRVSNRFLERCGQKHGIRVIWDEKRSNENQNVYYLSSNTDNDEAKEVALLAKDALQLQIPGEPPQMPTVGVLARKWELLKALEIELIRQEIPYDFEGETARGLRKEPKIQAIIDRALSLLAQAQGNQEVGDTQDGKIVTDLRNGRLTLATELMDRVRNILACSDLDIGPRSDYRKLLSALNEKPAASITQVFDRDETKAKVILSTVHSQKGEQFHTVFVIGLEKGNSPHQPPKSHEQILEWRKAVQKYSLASWKEDLKEDDLQRIYQQEEERIFYVAMTRARLNLIIGFSTFRNNKKFAASEFLEKAKIAGSVRDASAAYDITLAVPTLETAESGYRAEGRLYWTNAGVRVRSKSEAMLANELSRRGIFYEYELPPENISGVLPDFTLPDYGDVIIEHLGLLDDEGYRERWEQKKIEYAQAGRLYIATNEQEIQDVGNTVDRLVEQARGWVFQHFGEERIRLIERLEELRQSGSTIVGRAIGDFSQGIFEGHSVDCDMSLIILSEQKAERKETLQSMLQIPNGASIIFCEREVGDVHYTEVIPHQESICYFAYGSNMCLQRMTDSKRVPQAKFLKVGWIDGYSLRFHKISQDGSGKCNIINTGNNSDRVYGVFFDVPQDQKGHLDTAEGLGNGYHEEILEFMTDCGAISAHVHIADDKAIDDELMPYKWYKTFVVEGARQHGLPQYYIDAINQVVAIDDPDVQRDSKNRSIFSRS